MLRIFPVLSFVLIFFLIFLGVENLTADFRNSNQSEPEVTKFDLEENSSGFSDKSSERNEFENLDNKSIKKNEKEFETQKLQKISETKDKLDKKDPAESEISLDTESNSKTTPPTKDKKTKNDKETIPNGYRIQFGAFAKKKNAMEFKKKI